MGALAPPPGSGVKAVPTIWLVFEGLTVRCGSLSWFASPLRTLGIMLMMKTPPGAMTAPPCALLAAAFFAADLEDFFAPAFLAADFFAADFFAPFRPPAAARFLLAFLVAMPQFLLSR